MVPAPTMATPHSFSGFVRSFGQRSTENSTAADEIETAPLEIEVSERTRLPEATAVLSMRARTLPPEPAMRFSSSATWVAAW